MHAPKYAYFTILLHAYLISPLIFFDRFNTFDIRSYRVCNESDIGCVNVKSQVQEKSPQSYYKTAYSKEMILKGIKAKCLLLS